MNDYVSLLDRYSDEEFISIVKSSNSLTEIMRKLGYSKGGSPRDKVAERAKKLGIPIIKKQTSNKKLLDEEIFKNNSCVSQNTVKRHYKNGNYSKYECSICGQKPFWQGKELPLILDHIDGNNQNHSINNLRWVCPNCNYQLETTGTKNAKFRSRFEHKEYFCLDCGKKLSGKTKTGRCQSCTAKNRDIGPNHPEKKVIIQREKLKQLIRNEQFEKIATLFDVSDTTIRKYCKGYNLPYRKKDINSYSDEEWEKI